MYTLLKLFYLPRLKSVTWQVLLLNLVFVSSILLQSFEAMALCAIGVFYILFYNFMSMNFTDNLEWLRISVYSPKRLLGYYFIEQTLMFFTTVFYFLFTLASCLISITVLKINFADKLGSETSSLEPQGGLSSLTSQFQNRLEEYALTSPAENALELVFYFAILLSFVYGGQIIKSYFMWLHYEKKFTKEAKIFQTLMITSFMLFVVVDGRQLAFMHQFKIIVMPFLLGFGFFTLLHAANQSYKIFRLKPNSMIVKAPLAVFLVVFTFSFSFSKFNFEATKDLNEKIAERKFMGILGSDLENEFVLKAYYHEELSLSSLKYLISNYPIEPNDHFYKLVTNYDFMKVSELSKMWPIDKLDQDKREYFLTQLDRSYLDEKDEKKKSHYMASFHKKYAKSLSEKEQTELSIASDFLKKTKESNNRAIASE